MATADAGIRFIGWSIAGFGVMTCVAAIRDVKPWDIFTSTVRGSTADPKAKGKAPADGGTSPANPPAPPADHLSFPDHHGVTGVPI